MRLYIGIDNGTTGTIGVISKDRKVCDCILTPSMKEQSYTKKVKNITRIDHETLYGILSTYDLSNAIAVLERPLVNPGLFTATISAVRSLESTLCVLERLGVAIQYEDSKKWQKELLGEGIKGSKDLKQSSKCVSQRLFPQHFDVIQKHKDGDGLLLAEYGIRHNL